MARTSVEAAQLEMQTMLGTGRHISEIMRNYDDEQLEAILRGRLSAYATALAELVGSQEAFEIFSRLADAEFKLQHPEGK